jgi:hypothetical protein
MLNQKDSTIKHLNSKLAKEKANTAIQKAESNKQHVLNDSLQERFEKQKNLKNYEELVKGQKVEITEKDSVIESLDSEIEKYRKIIEDKGQATSKSLDTKS